MDQSEVSAYLRRHKNMWRDFIAPYAAERCTFTFSGIRCSNFTHHEVDHTVYLPSGGGLLIPVNSPWRDA